VRRKCIRIALEMVSSRNVHDVVAFFKKEIAKTSEEDFEKVRRCLWDEAFRSSAKCRRSFGRSLVRYRIFPVRRLPPAVGTGRAPVRDSLPGGRRRCGAHAHGLFGRLALRVRGRRHNLCAVRWRGARDSALQAQEACELTRVALLAGGRTCLRSTAKSWKSFRTCVPRSSPSFSPPLATSSSQRSYAARSGSWASFPPTSKVSGVEFANVQ